MKKDLPHVPQFVQIHVGQTDESERQEGLTVPPNREVGEQVTLIKTGRGAQEKGNHVIKVLIIILQYAFYSMNSSQQVEAPTEDTEHTGHDAWESHRLQHLRRRDALVLGRRVCGESIEGLQLLQGQLVGRAQLDLRLHVGQVDLCRQGAGVVVALFGFLDEGVKLDEGVRPHHAAYSLWVVRDDKLSLELVQEAEGQHIRVVRRADHQVPDAQGAGEIDIVRPGLEAAAVGELAEFLGEAFEVLLGLLQLFVLFIIGGGREGQAVFDPDH